MAMLNSTMQNCQRSLVLVDELGRGTSPDEGIGIAHALAENIIKNKVRCGFIPSTRKRTLTNSNPGSLFFRDTFQSKILNSRSLL